MGSHRSLRNAPAVREGGPAPSSVITTWALGLHRPDSRLQASPVERAPSPPHTRVTTAWWEGRIMQLRCEWGGPPRPAPGKVSLNYKPLPMMESGRGGTPHGPPSATAPEASALLCTQPWHVTQGCSLHVPSRCHPRVVFSKAGQGLPADGTVASFLEMVCRGSR